MIRRVVSAGAWRRPSRPLASVSTLSCGSDRQYPRLSLCLCDASEEARLRAREVRNAVLRLVKANDQLHDRADVLMREAEVTATELRDAMKQSSSEGLWHLSRRGFAMGVCRMTMSRGRFLDVQVMGQRAEPCDQLVAKHHSMLVLPGVASFVVLYGAAGARRSGGAKPRRATSRATVLRPRRSLAAISALVHRCRRGCSM
jgi:hypothetical protein